MKFENQLSDAAPTMPRASRIAATRSHDLSGAAIASVPQERARVAGARIRTKVPRPATRVRQSAKGKKPAVAHAPDTRWRRMLRALLRLLDQSLLQLALYGEYMYPSYIDPTEHQGSADFPELEQLPRIGLAVALASVGSAFRSAGSKIHQWRQRRQATVALRSLDDRTLKDLGISRYEIGGVVGYHYHDE